MWDTVDRLAAYLVSLDRDKTALTISEAEEIVKLYNLLHITDKAPAQHTVKSNMKAPTGRWRQQRKPGGSAPSQKASERYIFC